MYHSQNNETEIILNYFNSYTGRLLDIGANDGITFSNSYDLIKIGWSGVLVEPSPKAFVLLQDLYKDNRKVQLLNLAISTEDKDCILFDSGSHIKGGSDVSIVSTLKEKELLRWKNVDFTQVTVPGKTYNNSGINGGFDFISIDCEGMDYEILEQIDLQMVNCSCICLEHNTNKDTFDKFKKYCSRYGLNKQLLYNSENVIFAK